MKREQTGFTVVETLLVLILIAILGFTGYYVYHTQKSTNTNYSNAASVNNSASQPVNGSSGSKSKTLTFTNLGVAITLSSNPSDPTYKIKDMTYTQNPQYPDTSDDISTPGYASSAKSCDPNDPGNFGIISKQTGSYDPNVDQLINLKQFNGFWIAYAPNIGNPCAGMAGADQLAAVQADLKAALIQAFKTATEVK